MSPELVALHLHHEIRKVVRAIEQQGTYPLPEAQVDRFMLKLKLTYPTKEEELVILDRMSAVEPIFRLARPNATRRLGTLY